MGQLVVATFNIHAGIDGWGRPFDAGAVAACDELDADVLLLQETWTPEGGEGLAYAGRELARLRVARGASRRCLSLDPVTKPAKRWGPRNPRRYRSLWVGDAENLARLPRTRWDQARHGTWGIALLSRLPLRGVEAFELGGSQGPCTTARGRYCRGSRSPAPRSPSSARISHTSRTDRRSCCNACVASSRRRRNLACSRVT